MGPDAYQKQLKKLLDSMLATKRREPPHTSKHSNNGLFHQGSESKWTWQIWRPNKHRMTCVQWGTESRDPGQQPLSLFNHTTSWVQPSAFQWPSQHLAWQHSETIPGDLLKNSLRNYPSLVFYKIKSFWGVETSTSSQVKVALVRCVWHKLDMTPDLCPVSANFSKCWKGH